MVTMERACTEAQQIRWWGVSNLPGRLNVRMLSHASIRDEMLSVMP